MVQGGHDEKRCAVEDIVEDKSQVENGSVKQLVERGPVGDVGSFVDSWECTSREGGEAGSAVAVRSRRSTVEIYYEG